MPCNYKGIFTEPLPSNDRGIHRHTHRQQRDLISLLYFFKIGKYAKNWLRQVKLLMCRHCLPPLIKEFFKKVLFSNIITNTVRKIYLMFDILVSDAAWIQMFH
jgi:hypothetical protein